MHIRREYFNLVRGAFIKPRNLIILIRFFSQLVFSKINKKIKSNTQSCYPDRAYKILEPKLILSKYNKVIDAPCLGFDYSFKTSLFNYDAKKMFKWERVFSSEIKDEEILCSASRWYWMVYDYDIMKHTSLEEILILSKHWIRSFGYNESSLIWESYNASERISSFATAIIFNSSFENLVYISRYEKEIFEFLKFSINHIRENLEYYPGGISYNHVVNDLKGVLTAAIILNDEKLVDQTSELLLKELEIIVSPEGFIREGSSHYQFIVSRWIIELEWLCYLSDRINLKNKLRQWNEKLLKCCDFYFVTNCNSEIRIPLIGDVSPDFDPEWIVDYFRSYNICDTNREIKAYGWKILEDLGYKSDNNFEKENIRTCEYITRMDHHDITLFVRHQAHTNDFFPNHAHDDFTSFVLFYRGEIIISDPGRVNYLRSKESLNYIMSSSHNVIQVDSFSVQTSEWNRHFLPGRYKFNKNEVKIVATDDVKYLTVKSNSLNRISNKKITNYLRTFFLDSTGLIITDHLTTTSNYNFSGQFILSPAVKAKFLDDKILNLVCLEHNIEIEILAVNPYYWCIENCTFSDKYQFESRSTKVRFEKLSKPSTIHQFKFNFK
jgi:hypothetical protein